jgi:magnesium-transporting ATPase (P-type)
MSAQNYMQKEQKSLMKLINFRLPRQFMIFGLIVFGLSFLLLIFREAVFGIDSLYIKEGLQKSLLVSMLIMSLTKDKEEDEMTTQLRMQSYAWAFITGVIYALVMPYVEFGVGSILNEGEETIGTLGDFRILVFMLLVQLMSYHVLKRYR